MIELLLISIISIIYSRFFVWIDFSRLSLIPLFFLIVYIISTLSSFSVFSNHNNIFKTHGFIFSWGLILIWLMILLINQWLVWYHVLIILVIINTLLYYSSYQREYNEWKSLFSRWSIITYLSGIIYILRTHQYEYLLTTLALWSIISLLIYYSIPLWFTLNDHDQKITKIQQEIALYICIYVILYGIFDPNIYAVIVIQLWFTTLLIAIRQNYLATKDNVINKKKEGLTWRAILSGQKVLERYDSNTQSFSITFFTNLIKNGYMPSAFWMRFLQYSQIISIIGLIIISIHWILYDSGYLLIRYRLWILCFMITLFWIQSQEKLIHYYKPIALTLITWAYYITLFDTAYNPAIFTRGSLSRLCLNMITALFYKEIFPKAKNLFTHKDILFWLSLIIIGSVITVLSLIKLNLSWDILFAIWCIIIGIVSFFSYNIWRRNH